MYPKIVKVRSGKRYVKYLRLIKKIKVKGKWKEKVICNLGRQDVEGRYALGDLLKRLRRYTDEVLVGPEEIEAKRVFEYGALVVANKLWEEIGLSKWIRESCGKDNPGGLGIEGIKALVFNRLIEPNSKLGVVRWLNKVYLAQWNNKRFREGDLKTKAERFYRSLDWLIKGKQEIEKRIGLWARDLFPVDIVFYDLSNIQFEGEGPKVARIGYPRLGKKNHNQILIGVVMIEGLPVAHYLFRGNRSEKTTLGWISQKVRKSYNIGRIVFVVDRGLVSIKNLDNLDRQVDGYIVALKRRKNKEIKSLLDKNQEGFEDIKESLKAKQVEPDQQGRRRIICLNTQRQQEDKRKREAKLEVLEEELNYLKAQIDKGKIKKAKTIIARAETILRKRHGKRYFGYEANQGYFKFYRKLDSIEFEEKLDGKFILKTTEDKLSIKEVVLRYKDLMDVEDAFRDLKDFIQVRPIFHWKDRRVKAHIFICILALLLQRYMEKKILKANIKISSERAIEKLKTIKIVVNRLNNLHLKYLTTPSSELESILRVFGIKKLPKILSDIRPIKRAS